MPEKPVIDVMNDGPYIVRQLSHFTNSHNQPLETKPVTALCRCGHSKSKPYCDGTHGKIRFHSDKLPGATLQERHDFQGKEVTISDNEGVCAHAGFCDGRSPEVFWTFENGKRVPHPDKAAAEKIISTIRLCPSGALRYKIKQKIYDDFSRQPGIRVSKEGPYYVVGGVELRDEINSRPDSLEHYTLCRCGASKNKPFCDGSHGKIKFKDEKN
ncbi:MAG: CDGSH iron-sulfur domain-containing protein [Nanoarchaeota archaeon]